MKKNIFYATILLLAGAVMTACSGGDDMTSETTPKTQTPTESGVVELSGTLGGKSTMTRAVDDEGCTWWEEGDQFAIYYETSNGHASAVATVNSINEEDGSANFTATLRSPKTGNNSVKLVYPATAHDGQGGFKTDSLMNQDGTVACINQKGLDIETAETTMNVEGMNATLTEDEDVYLQPQVCLCYFYLYDIYDEYNGLEVTKLEISDGTNSYTVTPASATYRLFVALLPTNDADITFTATTTKEGPRRVYTKQSVTLDNCTDANVGHVFDKDGNIYSVSKGGTGNLYNRTYSRIKLEAGNKYEDNLKLSPSSGITPVAMIAYVGAKGTADASSTSYRGLAIAMDYATLEESPYYYDNEMPWSYYTCRNKLCPYLGYGIDPYYDFTYHRDFGDMKGIRNTDALFNGCGIHEHDHPAAKAAKNYSVAGFNPSAIGCSNWFLPSSGQWFRFFQACGVNLSNWNEWNEGSPGGAADADLVLNKMINAGVNLKSDEFFSIWTSTQVPDVNVLNVTCYKGSSLDVGMCQKWNTCQVYSFIAFSGPGGEVPEESSTTVNLKGMGKEESLTAF